MLLYARATGGWYLKPCLFLLDSESGEWICAPLLRVWYLNFPLQKKSHLTGYCFCRDFGQCGSGWSKKLVRALQTPSINTLYPCIFLEQDPFQRLNCSNLKPPSLSSSHFLPPFLCLLAETADLMGRRQICCGCGHQWSVASLWKCWDIGATMLVWGGRLSLLQHSCQSSSWSIV